MYALREAARELLEGGVGNRITNYQSIANTLRDGLSPLELSFLVPREQMSNTMTSVMLPEGILRHGIELPLHKTDSKAYPGWKTQ